MSAPHHCLLWHSNAVSCTLVCSVPLCQQICVKCPELHPGFRRTARLGRCGCCPRRTKGWGLLYRRIRNTPRPPSSPGLPAPTHSLSPRCFLSLSALYGRCDPHTFRSWSSSCPSRCRRRSPSLLCGRMKVSSAAVSSPRFRRPSAVAAAATAVCSTRLLC